MVGKRSKQITRHEEVFQFVTSEILLVMSEILLSLNLV